MLTASRGRITVALLGGAVALAVAGCGPVKSNHADTPANPPAAQTTAAANLPNPCEGITDADVTSITGAQIQTDDSGAKGGPDPYKPGDTQRTCAWGLKNAHLLFASQPTTASTFSPPGDAEVVSDIGDQAYFLKANNELHVRKGTLELVVSFTKDDSQSGDLTLIPIQKNLASKVLAKIAP